MPRITVIEAPDIGAVVAGLSGGQLREMFVVLEAELSLRMHFGRDLAAAIEAARARSFLSDLETEAVAQLLVSSLASLEPDLVALRRAEPLRPASGRRAAVKGGGGDSAAAAVNVQIGLGRVRAVPPGPALFDERAAVDEVVVAAARAPGGGAAIDQLRALGVSTLARRAAPCTLAALHELVRVVVSYRDFAETAAGVQLGALTELALARCTRATPALLPRAACRLAQAVGPLPSTETLAELFAEAPAEESTEEPGASPGASPTGKPARKRVGKVAGAPTDGPDGAPDGAPAVAIEDLSRLLTVGVVDAAYGALVGRLSAAELRQQVELEEARRLRQRLDLVRRVDLTMAEAERNAVITWRLGARRAADVRAGRAALTAAEAARVDQEVRRRRDAARVAAGNVCPHVKIYRRMRSVESLREKKRLLERLLTYRAKARGDAAAAPIICGNCQQPLVCPHVVAMVGASVRLISPFQMRRELAAFVDDDDDAGAAHAYFCKVCNEHMFDGEMLQQSLEAARETSEDPVANLLWAEIRHFLGRVRFNVDVNARAHTFRQLDPLQFTRDAVRALTPWVEKVGAAARKISTLQPDELAAWMELHAAIYAVVLVAVMASHDPLIELPLRGTPDALTEYVARVKAPALARLGATLRLAPAALRTRVGTAHAAMVSAYASGQSLTKATGVDLAADFAELQMANPVVSALCGADPKQLQRVLQAPMGALLKMENPYARARPAPTRVTAEKPVAPAMIGEAALWATFEAMRRGWYLRQLASGDGDGAAPVARGVGEPPELAAWEARLVAAWATAVDARRRHHTRPLWPGPTGPSTARPAPPASLATTVDKQGATYVWRSYLFSDGQEFTAKKLAAEIGAGRHPLAAGVTVVDLRAFPRWAGEAGVLMSAAAASAEEPPIQLRRGILELFHIATTRCPKAQKTLEHAFAGGRCGQCGLEEALIDVYGGLEMRGATDEEFAALAAYYGQYRATLLEGRRPRTPAGPPAPPPPPPAAAPYDAAAPAALAALADVDVTPAGGYPAEMLRCAVLNIGAEYEEFRMAASRQPVPPMPAGRRNPVQEYRAMLKNAQPTLPPMPELVVADGQPAEYYLAVWASTMIALHTPATHEFVRQLAERLVLPDKMFRRPENFTKWHLMRPKLAAMMATGEPEIEGDANGLDIANAETPADDNELDIEEGLEDNLEKLGDTEDK